MAGDRPDDTSDGPRTERAEEATTPIDLETTRRSQPTPAELLHGPVAGALLPPGSIIAEHVVADRLGTGGMGAVYRAVPVGGGTPVAIKWIASCDEAGRRRFVREAETAMRLGHPNVVRVLGFGQTESGGLWLTMELLEGEDLERRIRRGPLTVAQVLPIARQAAAALEAAHAAGIVHRDVKPSNLWLCRDDDRVKVLDFGIALDADASQARLTASSLSLGTPAYMAYEQARGTHDEDARTDVWGLGATLFAALAGRPPFSAPTIWAQIVRVATDEPDPLPDSVPVAVARVIRRALLRDREQRWPSVGAFADALEQAHARPASSPPELLGPVALVDEVRIVAVLLAGDVVDPDAVRAAVQAHGGRAERLLRRRAVGVFGGDAWQGDEAERAVRAALAVRAAGAAGRLGVATGRAFRSSQGVTGGAVATAERVLSVRGVGVDAETARRIRGGFELVAGGESSSSGSSVVARETPGRIRGVRGPAGADVPLLGRSRELTDLRSTVDESIAEPRACAVLISGPAGIGKSRLLHELLLEICERPEPGRPLIFEARGEAQQAQRAWHSLAHGMRQALGASAGTDPDELRARLAASSPSAAGAELLGEIVGAPSPPTPRLRAARADPAILRDQIVAALGDWLVAQLGQRPVLLVVEDAHWADAASLWALEVLLHRCAELPLIAVALARPDLEAALPSFRRLVLQGLSRRASETIVAAVLGPRDDLAQCAAAIHDRAGGHPYFVEELSLAWRDGVRDLPLSVEAAVRSRLDSLSREDRDLLRRAAVFGRRFWAEALRDQGEAAVASRLAGLRRRDLVLEEPLGRLAGQHEWRFRHALTHEVAHGSLTEEQRRELHGVAGRWLAERPDAPAVEVARHLELAGAAEEATPHWLRAAEGAFRQGDARAGLEASAIVLERGGVDAERAWQLRMARADSWHFLGRPDDEAEEHAALEALAVTAEQRARVAAKRTMALRLRGCYTEAIEAAHAGLAHAPDDDGLLAGLAFSVADAGRPEEAVGPAERAVAIARASGDPLRLGRSLAAVAHCHAVRTDVGAAWAPMVEALAALEEAGDLRRAAAAHGSLAYYAMVLGRWSEADQRLRDTIDLARRYGNRGVEGFALHNLGLVQARLGRPDEGLVAQDQAMAIAEAIREPRLRIASLSYRAVILLGQQRLDEADSAIEEALALPADQLGHLGPALRALRATLLVARGRKADALAEAREVLAIRDQAGGLEAFEAELFLAAHEAGLDGALERGARALQDKAARISDPALRASFLEDVPEHARLMALWRASGAGSR